MTASDALAKLDSLIKPMWSSVVPTEKKPTRARAVLSYQVLACPICREIFKEAVTFRCGHSICGPCFLGVLEGKDLSKKQKSSSSSPSSDSSQSSSDSSSSSSSDSSSSSSDSSSSSSSSSSSGTESSFDRWCPECHEGLHLSDLKSLRPSVTLNKLVSILSKNIPPKKTQAGPPSAETRSEKTSESNKTSPSAQRKPASTPKSEETNSTTSGGEIKGKLAHSAPTTSSSSSSSASSSSTPSSTSSSGWWGQSLAPTLAWSLDNVKKGLSKGIESLTNTPDVLLKNSQETTSSKDTPQSTEKKVSSVNPSPSASRTATTTSSPGSTGEGPSSPTGDADTDTDVELEAAVREAVNSTGSKGEAAGVPAQNESDAERELDEELEELLIEEENNNQTNEKA